jgi:hypothetical protein
MARAVEPGGVFAVTWNAPADDRSPIRLAIEAAYARHVPELIEGSLVNRWQPDDEAQDDPLLAADRFTDAFSRHFPWTQRYSSGEYVQLLDTHSDHRSLPDATRAALFADVAAAIDEHGGFLDYHYETVLRLYRRA